MGFIISPCAIRCTDCKQKGGAFAIQKSRRPKASNVVIIELLVTVMTTKPCQVRTPSMAVLAQFPCGMKIWRAVGCSRPQKFIRVAEGAFVIGALLNQYFFVRRGLLCLSKSAGRQTSICRGIGAVGRGATVHIHVISDRKNHLLAFTQFGLKWQIRPGVTLGNTVVQNEKRPVRMSARVVRLEAY